MSTEEDEPSCAQIDVRGVLYDPSPLQHELPWYFGVRRWNAQVPEEGFPELEDSYPTVDNISRQSVSTETLPSKMFHDSSIERVSSGFEW